MIKKFLSALLAVLMVVSMVPMAAMAEEPAAGTSDAPQAIEAFLHDTKESDPYTDDQLNVAGYKVAATKNETDSTDGVTVYDVTLTHPALLKHDNARKTNGAWIGFGVPAGTLGTSGKYYADGSAFYYGLGEVPTDYKTAGYLANPSDTKTKGYVAGGYLSSQSVIKDGQKYINRYWDVSSIFADGSNKTGFLVVKDPVEATDEQAKSGETEWTYRIYNVTFEVTEGHLVKYTKDPTGGTVEVKVGNKAVEPNTAVGKGSDLTITATPSTGYRVKAVTAGSDPLTADAANGTYTTKVANDDVVITAEFEQIPTLSAATASTETDLLGKSATDLQAITVTPSADKKTFTVNGTSKYVTEYTRFSSDPDEQAGNYIALELKTMKGETQDKSIPVWVKSSKDPGSWVQVDSGDDTIILLVNNYYAKGGKIEVAIAKDAPAAGAKGEYTIDISNLTLAEADPEVNTVTLRGIGFQADRVKAYQAMAALGSGAGQETIDNNTMFARFIGLSSEKSYKAEFYKGDTKVYDSLKTADAADSTVTGQTTATFYFTFNQAGGSKSLVDIAAGEYTVKLFEKATGATDWTEITDYAVIEGGSKAVAISSVKYDVNSGTGDVPPQTYYEIQTNVTMPAAPTRTGYNFMGWVNSNDNAVYAAGAQYSTREEDVTFKAGWESATIVSAKLIKGSDEVVSTVTVKVDQDTNAITLSGTLNKVDGTYKLVYTLSTGSTGETAVTLTDENGNITATCSAITIGDNTYTVTAENLSLATVLTGETTVNKEAVNNIDGISDEDKTELSNLLDKGNVVQVDDAPLESAVAGIAAEAMEEAPAGDTKYAVEISLAVEPKGYDSEAGTLTLDIKPVVKLVPIDGNGDKVSDGEPIDVPKATQDKLTFESVVITVKLPDALADKPSLYVKHTKDDGKVYYYDGTKRTSGGDTTFTFTNPHGFSTFEITAEGPVAKINTTGYASLEDAIANAGTNDIITIVKDLSGTSVTVKKTFKYKLDGGSAPTFAPESGHYDPEVSSPDSDGVYTVTPGGEIPTTPVGPTNPTNPTTYAVKTPSTIEGGKVSVSPTSAAQGSTVTVTVTPDEGYELDKLTVTDASGKAVSVTASGSRYTFTMPAGAVTVSASFKKAGAAWQNPFGDVKESAWYYNAVKYVKENKLMNGNEKGQFEPDKDLTRAEFAAILYNKEGEPATSWSNVFTDVPEGAWFAKQVVWAANKNILAGYGNGKAGPNDSIKREELAVLLWKYEGRPAPKSTELSFPDAGNVSSWAKDAMLWAVENGVISGTKTSGGTVILDPKGSASRAESAQMLTNYFGKK